MLRRTLLSRNWCYSQFTHAFKYSSCVIAKVLQYDRCGDPEEVIYEKEENITFDDETDDVHIKFLAGGEGVAKVIAVGRSVKTLNPGDHVIIKGRGCGTWRTDAVLPATQLIQIDSKIPIPAAAVMVANPSTAYLMLKNFTKLQPGDTVIQNGSTSAVGVYVAQLAKLWGFSTVNIIRPRDTKEATERTKSALKEFGATVVVTEEELRTNGKELLSKLGPVRLAVGCVAGKSVLGLLKPLAEGGVMVTYGAMNRQPMQIPVGPLIFNDVQIRGFWMSRWSERNDDGEVKKRMQQELSEAFIRGDLKPSPYDAVPFSDWRTALRRANFKDDTPTDLNRKQILVMDH